MRLKGKKSVMFRMLVLFDELAASGGRESQVERCI